MCMLYEAAPPRIQQGCNGRETMIAANAYAAAPAKVGDFVTSTVEELVEYNLEKVIEHHSYVLNL